MIASFTESINGYDHSSYAFLHLIFLSSADNFF